MLRARTFGALSVEVDGRPVAQVAGLKPRSLLAWLLLHPGPHARAHVAARFWPDVLDTSARASLRSALWTIRAALEQAGGSDYLAADRDTVAIARAAGYDSDVEEFERLSSSGDPADLERALALATKPLLSDLADDWVLEARDRLAERAAAAALRLADDAEAAGDLRRAALHTRQALLHDRLSEATHRLLGRRLADSGEPGQALAALRRLETLLAVEFGAAPSPETRALAGRLRAASGVETPPPPPPPPARPSGEASLFGRDADLAALAAAWDSARGGSGAVVVVSGPAGIGKSRLALELIELAAVDGALTISGVASGLFGAPPFSLWLAPLGELVAGAPPPPADAAWPGELARLCPAVELRWDRPAEPPPADRAVGRARLFESVVEAIQWAAAGRPVLIVLEDLHLADSASLALFAHVGRRLTRVRALVVATTRTVRREELVTALGALERAGGLVRSLQLSPLSDAHIAAIVDAAAPGIGAEARGRIVAAGDGNPLLAREAARAAAAGADPSEGLRAWVRAARAALGGAARVLVDLVAAAARPLSLAESVQLLGAERLPAALEEAAAAGLLDADGADVRFGHELMRSACYAEVAPARRARLHARLAAALGQRPRHEVAEVARHLLLAGDEQSALRYLAAAAEKAGALGALDEAAGFLREAAMLASGAVAAELWLGLAEVEARRGDRDGHERAFERAVALLEAGGDRAALAQAQATRGLLMRTAFCHPGEALAAYRRASAIIEVGGIDAPELAALAMAGRAWAEAAVGDPRRAEALIAMVQRVPEARDDPALATELALNRAMSLMRAGQLAASELQGVAAAEQARDAQRTDLARVALNLAASAAAARGDFAAALGHAERAIHAGRAGARLEAESHAARAYALSRLGRHEEAAEAARVERAIAEHSGNEEEEAIATFDAGMVALAAGRVADACRLLGVALESHTARLPRALARLRLAEARLLAGDADGAAREIARFPFEPAGPADLPHTLVPRLERVQGLVAAARGQPQLANRRLEAAEAGWRRLLQDDDAPEQLTATLVDLGRAPVAGLVEPGIELGRILAERALLYAEEGRVGEARAAVQEAARIADQLRFDGYRPLLERLTGAGGIHAGV